MPASHKLFQETIFSFIIQSEKDDVWETARLYRITESQNI